MSNLKEFLTLLEPKHDQLIDDLDSKSAVEINRKIEALKIRSKKSDNKTTKKPIFHKNRGPYAKKNRNE